MRSTSGRPRHSTLGASSRPKVGRSQLAGIAPDLYQLHIPKYRRGEFEDVADAPSERGRLGPFTPRHVGHFTESNSLDLIGQPQSFGLVGGTHPLGDELLELRHIGPAKPGPRTCARHAEVDGGIDDIRSLPP